MTIRPATADDWRFILARFISSFRTESTHADGLTGRQIAGMLTNLIANGWKCLVADYDGIAAGWVCFSDNNQLAWVYVRPELGFRGQGLGKLLVSKAGVDMSKPVYSPFVPNRNKGRCPFHMTIRQRPFLVLPREDPTKH